MSGYYSWLRRPPSARSIRWAWLTDVIGQVHADSRQTYGAQRVHAELTLGRGIAVCRNTIETLMRRAGLRDVSGRPAYRKIPHMATASDLVDRDFTRTEPGRLQVTDITEHPTREGKVYCAVVLDAFSRRVVGWSIDSRPTAALVTNSLGMAIQGRQPNPGETVIHSDQGRQFTSWAFTRRAGTHRLACSHPSSSKLDTNNHRQHESNITPPPNPRSPTDCAKPGEVQLEWLVR